MLCAVSCFSFNCKFKNKTFLCPTRFLYTTGTLMVAFSSSGENRTQYVFFQGNRLTAVSNVPSYFSLFHQLWPTCSSLLCPLSLWAAFSSSSQTCRYWQPNFRPSFCLSRWFLHWLFFLHSLPVPVKMITRINKTKTLWKSLNQWSCIWKDGLTFQSD